MPAKPRKPIAAVLGSLALAASLTAGGGSHAASDENVVTVYSADGLKGEKRARRPTCSSPSRRSSSRPTARACARQGHRRQRDRPDQAHGRRRDLRADWNDIDKN